MRPRGATWNWPISAPVNVAPGAVNGSYIPNRAVPLEHTQGSQEFNVARSNAGNDQNLPIDNMKNLLETLRGPTGAPEAPDGGDGNIRAANPVPSGNRAGQYDSENDDMHPGADFADGYDAMSDTESNVSQSDPDLKTNTPREGLRSEHSTKKSTTSNVNRIAINTGAATVQAPGSTNSTVIHAVPSTFPVSTVKSDPNSVRERPESAVEPEVASSARSASSAPHGASMRTHQHMVVRHRSQNRGRSIRCLEYFAG